MNDLNKITLNSGINIYIPDQAQSLIYEIWEEKCYTKEYTIKNDDIVVDIGANVGIFSILAATFGATVYAFEPNPESFNILKKNIDENNFNDKIKIFNYAVSDFDGFINLQIPISDIIYTLGSATTSNILKNELYANHGIKFKSIKSEAITLNSILENYIGIGKKINFLKVDCEGAEYSIFNGLKIENAKNIINVALETHAGYSEKEFVTIMNNKGFIFDRYIKRTGFFSIGYCYAHQKEYGLDNKKTDTKPIIILNLPDLCFLNKPIIINAEESFVLNDLKSNLNFSWYIDREKIKETKSSFIYSFSTTGPHLINCIINNDIDTDSQEKQIIVLENNYYNKKIDLYLKNEIETTKILIKDKTIFCIKKEYLPKRWHFNSITISIFILNLDTSDSNIIFISNGNEYPIEERYKEIEINSVNPELDIIFTIKLKRELNFKIKWWIKKEEKIKKEVIFKIIDNNECNILSNISLDNFFIFEQEKFFMVLKDFFPKDWMPFCIKIGIAAITMNGSNKQLNGFFKYNNHDELLTDWFKEICINNFKFDDNFKFSIFFKEKRAIRVVWWVE